MHRTIFAIALAVFIALIATSLLSGCEPCYDGAGATGYPGCNLTDRWEGVN